MILQEEFGAGIFRGRRAPEDSVYDAVNALIDDERLLFRRGGSAFKSGSAASGALLGLWDGFVREGQRTLFWTSADLYALAADDSTIALLAGSTASVAPSAWASGVALDGLVYFAAGQGSSGGKLYPREVFYAGSRKTASYSTGTVSVTAGSKTATGVGTTWTTNVDAGMLAYVAGTFVGIVQSVESNTSLTLLHPSTVTLAGLAYAVHAYGVRTDTATTAPFEGQEFIHATAGQRLLRCVGNRVYYSAPTGSGGIAAIADYITDYHELPRGARIVGADSLNDVAILFTTAGVWAIANMAYDDVDAFGNIQHSVSQVSQDVILWGEAGIYGWGGALLVPAVDDVFLVAPGSEPKAVSESIRPMYREYVEAGYKPGNATVHRGHYLLPIVDGSNVVVDALVCRLDGGRGPAWTRWANHAAGGAYALRVGASARQPVLLGVNSTRVTNLTACFAPASAVKADADATNHVLTVVTRDFAVRPQIAAFWKWLRARFELSDAASDNPTMTAEFAVGPVAGESWTSMGSWAEGTGESPTRLAVGKSAQSIRFRLKTSGAAKSAVLRSVEIGFRGSRKR